MFNSLLLLTVSRHRPRERRRSVPFSRLLGILLPLLITKLKATRRFHLTTVGSLRVFPRPLSLTLVLGEVAGPHDETTKMEDIEDDNTNVLDLTPSFPNETHIDNEDIQVSEGPEARDNSHKEADETPSQQTQ